ncbi:MAG: hypothetical protein QOG91_401 [Candidatus Parcubacteria bacterium]|nr:hypothetical protein [Candidatus Parcubacteria bacterium]
MIQINRLEQALQTWERTCFLLGRKLQAVNGLNKRASGLRGPYKSFGEFRQFLLSRNPRFPDKFLWDTESERQRDYLYGGWFHLPQEIHMWSVSSRRIYRIGEELQQFFEITSLGNVTFNDITLPFEAFGIALSSAIRDPRNRKQLGLSNVTSDDFLLVTRQPGCEEGINLHMRLIGIDPNFCPLAKKVKQRIDRLIAWGTYTKALAVIEEVQQRVEKSDSNSSVPMLMVPKSHMNMPIREFLQNEPISAVLRAGADSQEIEECVQATVRTITRIVIGLCLYLDSLSRKRKAQSPRSPAWTPPETVETDPAALLSEAQVCTVSHESLLSDHDRKFCALIREKGLPEALREMGTHFRRAHWRRPPGKGDDPTAEGTVHVSSTIVRPDRLPDIGLPPGSQTNIK